MNIVVFGATSTIAEAVCRLCAGNRGEIFLVARNTDRLAAVASDLEARGAKRVAHHVLDANNAAELDDAMNAAWAFLSHVDVVLIAHGTLTDQSRAELDESYAMAEFQTNAASTIRIMNNAARRLAMQSGGTLAVIGSVAGDRGRPSNYLYGAAKGAVAIFADGLRARMRKEDVHVLTIKPGFVETAMTAHLSFPSFLVAKPERVAQDIYRALPRHQSRVLYTPWFWRWIMLLIRGIPRAIFDRMGL
jgi:decaprenylphospho-beta-D-erythro-pentofuranosid-2-ulose 2-reductase